MKSFPCCVCVCVIRQQLEKLRGIINGAKKSKIDAARPQILSTEENLHNMLVNLDKAVNKVSPEIQPVHVRLGFNGEKDLIQQNKLKK